MKRLVLLIAFVYSCNVNAQSSLYAITASKDILRIDPVFCSVDTVLAGYEISFISMITDIAYEQGVLYVCDGSHIFSLDPLTGQLSQLMLGNAVDPNLNGLTGGQDGFLYGAGSYLTKIDPLNLTFEILGDLGCYAQGDIEKVDNQFVITATDTTGVKVLLNVNPSPFSVTVVDTIVNLAYGLAEYPGLNNGELFMSRSNSLYTINYMNGDMTLVCPSITSYSIFGLTLASLELDLPEITIEPRKVIQIYDLMGRETADQPNTVLIYVYSDGSSEKVFHFE